MKILAGIFAVMLLLVVSACNLAPPPDTPLPRSMKGYEIYSWQQDSSWNFTLITGTNRNKTAAEVTAPGITTDGMVKITVRSADSLALYLSKLPAGEDVIWAETLRDSGKPETVAFGYPSEDIINTIKGQCQKAGVKLSLAR